MWPCTYALRMASLLSMRIAVTASFLAAQELAADEWRDNTQPSMKTEGEGSRSKRRAASNRRRKVEENVRTITVYSKRLHLLESTSW
jgi:hypothetical protein